MTSGRVGIFPSRAVILAVFSTALLGLAVSTGCATLHSGSKVDRDIAVIKREKSPELLFRRGEALVRLGDTTRAVQYLTAALDQGAPPQRVLRVLLPVLIKDGRYRVAIEHARHYVESHRLDVRMRFLLGTLYQAVGNTHLAAEQFTEVIRLAPGHAQAHFALGRLLRDEGNDLIEADRQFRIYLKLQPTGPHADEARSSLLGSVP